MKRLVLFMLVFLAGLSHASENQAGFVLIASDGIGHIYFPSFLALPKSVFIQWPDAHNRIQCCLKIDPNNLEKISPKTDASSQSITIFNLRNDGELSFSVYKIASKMPHVNISAFTGMAIAADKVIARSPYHIMAYTNGKKLSAKICFGTEGKNLIANEEGEYQLLYMNFGCSINEKPKCNNREQRILESAAPN